MNQYELMFLFEPTFAADFSKVRAEVERIVERADGEIVRIAKWDERKLAYEIKGCKRGCYVLTYINFAGDKITGIERDVRLSEPILRVLIKRADGLSLEHMQRFLPTERAVADDTAPTTAGDDAIATGDSVAVGSAAKDAVAGDTADKEPVAAAVATDASSDDTDASGSSEEQVETTEQSD